MSAPEAWDFEAAYRQYRAPLAGYLAGKIGGDSERADDLAHDALLKAWQRRDTFTGGTLKTWLFRIGLNTLIDQERAKKIRPTEDADVDGLPAARVPSTDVTPERLLLARETDRATRSLAGAAFLYLRPRYAQPLWLADVDGLDHDAIGERFGLARAAVKSQLYRARQAMDAAVLRERSLIASGRGLAWRLRGLCRPGAAPTDCWEWLGTRGASHPRPLIKVFTKLDHNGPSATGQRAMYATTHGPVSPWLSVSVTCGDKLCANPKHLALTKRLSVRGTAGWVFAPAEDFRA